MNVADRFPPLSAFVDDVQPQTICSCGSQTGGHGRLECPRYPVRVVEQKRSASGHPRLLTGGESSQKPKESSKESYV